MARLIKGSMVQGGGNKMEFKSHGYTLTISKEEARYINKTYQFLNYLYYKLQEENLRVKDCDIIHLAKIIDLLNELLYNKGLDIEENLGDETK